MPEVLKSIIAQNREEVGQKFLDFFSIGHILLGLITYAISFSVILSWGVLYNDAKFISLASTFYFGLFWELFENFTRMGMRFRTSEIKDSLINSLSDILFTSLGAVICFFLLRYFWIIFFTLLAVLFLLYYLRY